MAPVLTMTGGRRPRISPRPTRARLRDRADQGPGHSPIAVDALGEFLPLVQRDLRPSAVWGVDPRPWAGFPGAWHRSPPLSEPSSDSNYRKRPPNKNEEA
jgi:hypothetical protein